jgi:K+-transporting ATPase KdpF subunit
MSNKFFIEVNSMKLNRSNKIFSIKNIIETMQNIGDRLLKNSLAKVLFFTISLNLIIAPVVMAASGNEITRNTAYAIGALYCVTIALSVYLFTVIFQPERF